MAIKTYLVGLTIVVRHLCRYFIRYQAVITASINSSSMTADQKSTVLSFCSSIQAACTLLEDLTGY